MFGNLPDDVKTYLMKDNVTPNFHSYGVTVQVGNTNGVTVQVGNTNVIKSSGM